MAKPPIIANQKGDVLLFESVEGAESYVEPIDVENGEYVIFDSEGLVLIPSVMEDRVHVRLLESVPADQRPEELVSVLRRKLSQLGEKKTGVPEDRVWGMPLSELLVALQRAEQKHPRRRGIWPWRRR